MKKPNSESNFEDISISRPAVIGPKPGTQEGGSERFRQKLILCDEQGKVIEDLDLDSIQDFHENETAEALKIKGYFESILSDLGDRSACPLKDTSSPERVMEDRRMVETQENKAEDVPPADSKRI